MRSMLAFISLILVATSSPAIAGMRLTLVMVAPDQVATLAKDSKSLEKLLFGPDFDERLRMEKEWHGIHFLLTGDPMSTQGRYGSVILGGKEIGPDRGYGPARILSPEQVAEIAKSLRVLSIDELRRRYDPDAMTKLGIYPDIWDREGPQALEWLLVGYRNLVAFYVCASEQRKAVILAIL